MDGWLDEVDYRIDTHNLRKVQLSCLTESSRENHYDRKDEKPSFIFLPLSGLVKTY